ncbi:isoleucine--tRNA ligase, partial [Candidatus Gottesmanbacteria bacterium RBG_16_43_7]
KSVNPNISFPLLEEEVLSFWKKHDVFHKSIELKPKDITWTFVDGPPFITGLPHYGSLLSSIPKDLFPRYWTMKGYRIRRVWGWDCHGLPAENKVENTLGIKRKKDIEQKVGIAKFIDECKLYVQNVSGEWEWYIDRIARWVDFQNAYKTMDTSYMESVMWIFSQMYTKGYIYKGLRVSLYCPHCSTPISNFEVAMDQDNYQQVRETATTYKYKVKNEKDTYILAWSTTPWNKLATPALAVNPKLTYIKIKQGKAYYILAESTTSILSDEPYQVIDKFLGVKLVDVEFEPHYDFYNIDAGKRAFVVIPADFVTAQEGTGVVTIAAYGEDDLAIMQAQNIQIVMHVDEEGILKPEVPKWAGMFYLDVNSLVNDDLKSRGLIYRDDMLDHTVPTCWRCHTRLIFAPQNAWYVNIQKLKPDLVKTNQKVNWYPDHFKFGRYLKSLESAPDWCISRSRYWGSPVPVWECGCGFRFVPESISELEKKSGQKVTDLHKPTIDEITVSCEACGQKAHRVTEVLDSWIEAGSATFAERHYPFDRKLNLPDFFPPDFIIEYTGQIRAWFYVMHVIATAVFSSHAFRNVLVTGVILGSDGRKMSKNFGNYPDPKEMLTKYGGDALRLYLMGSPVMHAEDILISEEQYRHQIREFLLPLWNIYNFFISYAITDDFKPTTNQFPAASQVLDKWITSRCQGTLQELTANLEKYDTVAAVSSLKNLIDDISLWYIRRSRDRIGPSATDQKDKLICYQSLYCLLVELTYMLAPIAPFVADSIFKNLTGLESVHLESWPKADLAKFSPQLEDDMTYARTVVESIHARRKALGIKVRQPLAGVIVYSNRLLSAEIEKLILDETNIKSLSWSNSKIKPAKDAISVQLDANITPELTLEGQARDLIRLIQVERKLHGLSIDQKITLTIPKSYQNLTADLLDRIRRQTLVQSLIWGEKLKVTIGS